MQDPFLDGKTMNTIATDLTHVFPAMFYTGDETTDEIASKLKERVSNE